METQTTEEFESRIGISFVERLAGRLGTTASARAVFGEPVRNGEVTVIPVARTSFGFGGGAGPAAQGDSLGVGEGGGGGAVVRPLGFIEVRPEGARFRRIRSPLLVAVTLAAVALPFSRALRRVRLDASKTRFPRGVQVHAHPVESVERALAAVAGPLHRRHSPTHRELARLAGLRRATSRRSPAAQVRIRRRPGLARRS
jgi:uncharacterized spore protein YtfJ